MPIRFAVPEALVLLILLPAVFALTRRRLLPRGVVGLRLLALGLIILGLAQPELPLGRPSRTVTFVMDLSDSIPAAANAAAVEFIRSAARTRQPGDRIGLITFGANAIVEEAPTTEPQLRFSSHPQGARTDIAHAIRTALAAMPGNGERQIVLVTDGNANRGDLATALALARSEGVRIDVLPVGPVGEAEVLIDEVRAPQEVRLGERFPVRIVVEATAPTDILLRVEEDSAPIVRRSMAVPAGRTIVTVDRLAKREGLLHYTASITAPAARRTANKRAAALVSVRGTPVVWYVAAQQGPLARGLSGQGWRVRHLHPQALPTMVLAYQGTAAVVLDDVSATTLAPAQMKALRDYVGLLGGGLVVAGGPHSFGVGGYLGTPLEEVLPVAMDIRHRLAIPSMAIILVIDASGSMGSYGQEIAPLELAKETAQTVIDLLGERDVIGAIAFDQAPRWLVPPTQARNRETVFAQISRLQSGGGTSMHPAIALAYDYLRQSPAKVRHAIVLSDGQTDPGDFRSLLTQMARSKITVSTVAIGGDADIELMRNVAAWGGGRAYVAKDLYTIPQIFTAEALLASRVYVVEDTFTPRIIRDDLLSNIRDLPILRGYIATSPKPASTVYLTSPQDDPILAAWQYGSGRAVAFTSDASSRWAADWISWPQFARFWSQLVRSVVPSEGGTLQMRAERDRDGAVVTLDAQTPGGEPLDDLDVEASILASRGPSTRLPLVLSAPGRYEGRVAFLEEGEYAVVVTARRARDQVGVRTTALVIPYSPELRDLSINRATLARITETTGGRLLTEATDALRSGRQPPREATPAWPFCAAAAVGAFIVEVVVRRLPVLGAGLAAVIGALRMRWQHPPSAEAVAQNRAYTEADRWNLTEPSSPTAAQSMEAAAQLYIARLKSLRRDRSTHAAWDEWEEHEKPK